MNDALFETEVDEAARLAQLPEGSVLRAVSDHPVTIAQEPMNLPLRLPAAATPNGTLVVVPIRRFLGVMDTQPYRWDGNYDCLVIASDDPSHTVGGPHINIPTEVLRRSALAEITL